jgi:hypothetical protein
MIGDEIEGSVLSTTGANVAAGASARAEVNEALKRLSTN